MYVSYLKDKRAIFKGDENMVVKYYFIGCKVKINEITLVLKDKKSSHLLTFPPQDGSSTKWKTRWIGAPRAPTDAPTRPLGADNKPN